MATTVLADRKLTAVGAVYAPGRARWATVKVEAESRIYVGRLYVPETKKRVSDILSDERLFINMVDVSVDGSSELEPFVALNKRYIRTVRVIDEGRAEEPRRMARGIGDPYPA
jgi:hypothetical protein